MCCFSLHFNGFVSVLELIIKYTYYRRKALFVKSPRSSKMVFFSCNACGESVKKNQVEKHYTQQCRNCEMLSCIDCGKDFW